MFKESEFVVFCPDSQLCVSVSDDKYPSVEYSMHQNAVDLQTFVPECDSSVQKITIC